MKRTLQAATLIAAVLSLSSLQPSYGQTVTWFVEGVITLDEHVVSGGPIFVDCGGCLPGHPWSVSVTYDPALAVNGIVAPASVALVMSRHLAVSITPALAVETFGVDRPIVFVELTVNPNGTPQSLVLKTSDTGVPGLPDKREYRVDFHLPGAALSAEFFYADRTRIPNPVMVTGTGSFPGLCANNPLDRTDTDGDALLDCWETAGIDYNGDGKPDLLLYDEDRNDKIDPGEVQADPTHRDIFVEIDWMKKHEPDAGAIADVALAFRNAPLVDGRETRLHTYVAPADEAISHEDRIYTAPGCVTGPRLPDHPLWADLMRENFGTEDERRETGQLRLKAKRLAFHHVLFAHLQTGTTSSGCGEVLGNEFVVTLGAFGPEDANKHRKGNSDAQAATFMHELGHNLGLLHGGGDPVNCKPNYLSIMSYSRQFDRDPIPGRVLDYSRDVFPGVLGLNENSLVEVFGIQGPADRQTTWGPKAVPRRELADRQLDWNDDGAWNPAPLVIPVDINNFVDYGISECTGAGTVLNGYDDWSNLRFDFRQSPNFAPGIHTQVDGEMTWDDVIARSGDADADSVKDAEDNCPEHHNPGQLDSNDDGVGDACTFLYGDSNLDNSFDMTDLNTVVAWLLGREPFPDQGSIPFLASDVNADVAVNMADLNLYVDCLLGRIERFPVHSPDEAFCRPAPGTTALQTRVAFLDTSGGVRNHLTQLLNNVQNHLNWGYNETARSRLVEFMAVVISHANRTPASHHHIPWNEVRKLIRRAAELLVGIPVHGAISLPEASAWSVNEMRAEIQALPTSGGVRNYLTQLLNNFQNYLDWGHRETARYRMVDFIAEVVNASNRPSTSPDRLPLDEANGLILGAVNVLVSVD